MLLKDFIDLMQRLAPSDLALDWDNCGLQAGSAGQTVSKIGLALDATAVTASLAIESGCDLLLSHHPLLFRPIKNIDFDREPGSVIKLAAENGLAVFSAHTNWDAAEKGVADALADVLELQERRPLEPVAREFYKLVVFVPAGYEDALRRALFEAGAGVIGDYDRSWFASSGEGGFRASPEARPFIGERGEKARARESRLEVIVPKNLAERAARAVWASHPYEEPAFEFQAVKTYRPGQGLGLIGRWPEPRDPFREAARLNPHFKWAGPRPARATRVALLPGSGGSYMHLAKKLGAEVFITGDVDYHLALEAESLALTVMDLGHYETEWPGVLRLARRLNSEIKRLGLEVECRVLDQKPAWHYQGTGGQET